MVDFICIGLVVLQGTRSKRELQNTKVSLTVEFEPTAFRLQVSDEMYKWKVQMKTTMT